MKLHIGNLARTTTDAELTDLITPIAKPLSVEIIRDATGASKGFGFADFATDDEAKAVITGIDGKEMAGNALKLGEARPRRTNTRS
jgi:RNA recognition motif-containing protein